MNYEAMSDDEINYEVAKHSFDAAWLERHYGKEGMIPDYCNNVEDAWQVIFDNKITVFIPNDTHDDSLWMAELDEFHFFDKNPLRAAMIVFLMMRDEQK